jgi:hypothetical protein
MRQIDQIKNRFSLLIILVLLSFKSFGQAEGSHPSTIKWKTIENDKVRIIFNDSLEKEAIRVANFITYINENKTISVGSKSKKLDLLLSNNTVEPNGYVGLAPYRSVFYTTGFQNVNSIGTVNWLDGLAIHEYRHALQFANARTGFTKFMYYFMGETGWAVASNLSIPNWYFEGDAVLAETLFSNNGRGRNPDFFKEQRALLLNNITYSYQKARNGSYKDMVPNHYPLGFAMLNYGRNHYGVAMWPKVLAEGASYKKTVWPFSRSLKENTDLNTSKMYTLAYKELQEQWQDELKNISLTPSLTVKPEQEKTVTNYIFPNYLADGSIVCIRNSYKETPYLIQIKEGIETKLCAIGVATENYLNVNGNKASWTEERVNPRRNSQSYSVIVTYDLVSKKRTEITKKTKLFSPSFNNNGDKIVVVQANENNNNTILILNESDGSVLKRIPNPENDFISYPNWSKDENEIVYIAKRNSLVSLQKMNLATAATTPLTPWSAHAISTYTMADDQIYYTASYSGINNIYAVDLNGKQKIKQITSVKINAEMPALSKDRNTLLYSDYTPKGSQLVTQNLLNLKETTPTIIEPSEMERYKIRTTDIEHNILDSIPTTAFVKKDYKSIFNGIKLHSWDIKLDKPISAINLHFDNILNDFSSIISMYYNSNEQKAGLYGGLEYAKYFIKLNASLTGNNRSTKAIIDNHYFVSDFRENIATVGASLPLNWIKGNYYQGLKLYANYENISTDDYTINNVDSNNNFRFNALQLGFAIQNLRRMAPQNLQSRWGQIFDIMYVKSLDDAITSEKITASATVRTPGLLANHGMQFNFRIKKELQTNDYLFQDTFVHARGYSQLPHDLEKVTSIDYRFPICYPDFGMGGILYLKRIRANLFYDKSTIELKDYNLKFDQNSTGFEVFMDTKLFNVQAFTLGFRTSFLQNEDFSDPNKTIDYSVLFSIGF